MDIQRSLLQSLARDVSQKDAAVATLQEKLELLEADFCFNLGLLAERDSALDQCEAKLRVKNASLYKKETEISDLKVNLDDLNKRLQQLNDQNAALNQQIVEVKALKDSQLRDAKRNLELVSSNMNQELAQAHKNMQQQLSFLTSNYEQKLSVAEEEHRTIIKVVEDDREKEMTKKSVELEAKNEQIYKMEKENHSLLLQIAALKDDITSNQKNIQTLKNKQVEIIKDLKDKLLEKENFMKKEIARIHSSYKALTKVPCKNCENIKNKMEKEELQVEFLKNQITELNKMKEKKDDYIKEIEEKLYQAKNDAQKLNEEKDSLKKAIKMMRIAAEETMAHQAQENDSPQNIFQENNDFHNNNLEMYPMPQDTVILKDNITPSDQPPINQTSSSQGMTKVHDVHSTSKYFNMRKLRYDQECLREESRNLIKKLSQPIKVDQCQQTTFPCNCKLKYIPENNKDLNNISEESSKKLELEENKTFTEEKYINKPESKFEKWLLHLEDLTEKLKESMIDNLRSKLTNKYHQNGMVYLCAEPSTNECLDCSMITIPTKFNEVENSEEILMKNLPQISTDYYSNSSSDLNSLNDICCNLDKSQHSSISGSNDDEMYRNQKNIPGVINSQGDFSGHIVGINRCLNAKDGVECILNHTGVTKSNELNQDNINKLIHQSLARLCKDQNKVQSDKGVLLQKEIIDKQQEQRYLKCSNYKGDREKYERIVGDGNTDASTRLALLFLKHGKEKVLNLIQRYQSKCSSEFST